MSTRTPNEQDRGRIRAALSAALHLSLAPTGSEHTTSTVRHLCDDMEYTVSVIVDGDVSSVVIDEAYLLVYSVGQPWYSLGHTVFQEDLVLRIGSGSNFGRVVETMEGLAAEHNCSTLLAGGALSRSSRAITRLYRMHGFELEDGVPQFTRRRA